MKKLIVICCAASLLIACGHHPQVVVSTEDPQPPPSCLDATGAVIFDPAEPLPTDCLFAASVLDFSVLMPRGWKLWPDGLPALYRTDAGLPQEAREFSLLVWSLGAAEENQTWREQCAEYHWLTGPENLDAGITMNDEGICTFRFTRQSYGHHMTCTFIGRRLSETTRRHFFVMACGSSSDLHQSAVVDGWRMTRSVKDVFVP